MATRELQIEHEQVEVLVAREQGGGNAVGDDRGRKAARSQALVEEGGDAGLVLGDEDPVHRSASCAE